MSSFEAKVAVLGSSKVGKTCFTERFVADTFVDLYESTIEEQYSKQVRRLGVQAKLAIVDTGGCDVHDAAMWAVDRDGIALVYDIRSSASLEKVIELFPSLPDGLPVVLVGTHLDEVVPSWPSDYKQLTQFPARGTPPYLMGYYSTMLEQNSILDNEGSVEVASYLQGLDIASQDAATRRQVPYETAVAAAARMNDAVAIEVSSKDNTNIDTAWEALASAIYIVQKGKGKRKTPKSRKRQLSKAPGASAPSSPSAASDPRKQTCLIQ